MTWEIRIEVEKIKKGKESQSGSTGRGWGDREGGNRETESTDRAVFLPLLSGAERRGEEGERDRGSDRSNTHRNENKREVKGSNGGMKDKQR